MMRIAHVLTQLSPDGAYGGPLRVALNQMHELARLGHEVTLFSTASGFESLPASFDGIPVVARPSRNLLPGHGFAGVTSPGLLAELARHSHDYDVVHIHFARDLVALPAAWLAQKSSARVVLQTHGMVDPSSRALAWLVDRLITVPALRRAQAILFLTAAERDDLTRVAGGKGLSLFWLPNGVPAPGCARREPGRPEAIFLSRLHPRKRVLDFAEAALNLAAEIPEASFAVVGPDEGDGPALTALLDVSRNPRVTYEGPLSPSRTLERLAQASVFVLPSIDEPFGMVVLEAASLGIPVIVARSCGLADAVARYSAGIVVDDGLAELEQAMRRLLSDPVEREAMGAGGLRMIEEEFKMSAVGERLIRLYMGNDLGDEE